MSENCHLLIQIFKWKYFTIHVDIDKKNDCLQWLSDAMPYQRRFDFITLLLWTVFWRCSHILTILPVICCIRQTTVLFFSCEKKWPKHLLQGAYIKKKSNYLLIKLSVSERKLFEKMTHFKKPHIISLCIVIRTKCECSLFLNPHICIHFFIKKIPSVLTYACTE